LALNQKGRAGGSKNLWIPLQRTCNKNFVEVEKMEKVRSIRKGNIWLNVLMTKDGQILATVNKSYRDKNGQWGQTHFLNPSQGDIGDLVDALEEFRQFEKMRNGWAQQ
jgi:hypothetical protein